jgi:hypothetical protein
MLNELAGELLQGKGKEFSLSLADVATDKATRA